MWCPYESDADGVMRAEASGRARSVRAESVKRKLIMMSLAAKVALLEEERCSLDAGHDAHEGLSAAHRKTSGAGWGRRDISTISGQSTETQSTYDLTCTNPSSCSASPVMVCSIAGSPAGSPRASPSTKSILISRGISRSSPRGSFLRKVSFSTLTPHFAAYAVVSSEDEGEDGTPTPHHRRRHLHHERDLSSDERSSISPDDLPLRL